MTIKKGNSKRTVKGPNLAFFVLFLGILSIFGLFEGRDAEAAEVKAEEATLTEFAAPVGVANAEISVELPQDDQGYVETKLIEFESIEAKNEFNAVGARWQAEVPETTSLGIELRISKDGQNWEDWRKIELEEPAKDGMREVENFGELVFVEGRWVQLRARMETEDSSKSPILKTVKLSLIDSRGVEEKPAGVAEALPLVNDGVIARSGWGADEGLMRWGAQYAEPKMFVIHHTAGSQGGSDPGAVMRGIYYYHSVIRGWGDIGYNYVIDEHGNIYEGRAGGEKVVGGHAYGYNTGTIGISVMGNYENYGMSAAASNALVTLVAKKSKRFGLNPQASTWFNGQNLMVVSGHRDVGSTACPGYNIYSRLGEYRNLAKQKLDALNAPRPTGIYRARVVGIESASTVAAGQLFKVKFKIRNTGTRDILAGRGRNRFVVAKVRPANTPSPFYHPGGWFNGRTVGTLSQARLKPGQVGTVEYYFKAPNRGGKFTLSFRPRINGVKWLDSRRSDMTVRVWAPYRGKLIYTNFPGQMKVGQEKVVTMIFQNTGRLAWRGYGNRMVVMEGYGPHYGKASQLFHWRWLERFRPAKIRGTVVGRGQYTVVAFRIKAPDRPGLYHNYWNLRVKDFCSVAGTNNDYWVRVTR